MSQVVPFLDEQRIVFEVPEKAWGPDTTTNLVDLLRSCDTIFFEDGDGEIGVKLTSATASLSDAGTLAVAAPLMKVASTGGNVSFSLADGEEDNQLLEIVSTDSNDTLVLPSSGNALLNGDMVFAQHDRLALRWDEGESLWIEINRNN